MATTPPESQALEADGTGNGTDDIAGHEEFQAQEQGPTHILADLVV